MILNITAKITGISYTPYLCSELKEFDFDDLDKALNKASSLLRINDKNVYALSRWVSPKRTRSYPYARVYDTLSYSGKKVTIIPVIKDEGAAGDRDFIQWDTVSLMSLLNVYVILTYYKSAEKSKRKKDKITNQKYDIDHIKENINALTKFNSDALHWNLKQIDNIYEVAGKALSSYSEISKKLNIPMHSSSTAEKKIKDIYKEKEDFMSSSRSLAESAQRRESATIHRAERIEGEKGIITISNYVGGIYFFTADEVIKDKNKLFLAEAKHTSREYLPSTSDIKDGLLKMILFSNLTNVRIGDQKYQHTSLLKLTTETKFDEEKLNTRQKRFLETLRKEAVENNFQLQVNSC